jgi:hypothetical protein
MTCHITWTPEVRRAHGEVSGRSQRAEIDQGQAFALAWREGRRDEVLALYVEPGGPGRYVRSWIVSDYEGPPRAAIGHMPFSTGAPRVGPPSGFDSPSPEGGSSSVGD